MKTKNKKPNGVNINKTKLLATLIASFAVFAMTYFAMAANSNSNNLFLDTDQDGLTNQEEKMIGTDPANPDTDGDGYSDGKELASGYNPLKSAPGDQLMPGQKSVSSGTTTAPASAQTSEKSASESLSATDLLNNPLGSLNNNLLDTQATSDLTSDPENPNLTNEMIGSFLQLTLDKSGSEGSFSENPTYSPEDFDQIVQNALASSGVSQNLPEIRDDEIKVLPKIDDKKLNEEEVKEKEKEQIQKYLASLAFVFATNSPFAVEKTSELQPNLLSEGDKLISAIMSGNQSEIDNYAQKVRSGIDQVKKVEVPYALKDLHKSALQLAIYSLDFKNSIAVNSSDPLKSLAAIGSLESVSESATKLQQEMANVLEEYGIGEIELK